MKIGVDLDATITAYPEFFSVLTKAMAQAGHEIHIITNRPTGTEEFVATQGAFSWGFWYKTNPHKKMRVDAWVKPFFAITYKANNAQGIIPFGIRRCKDLAGFAGVSTFF